jgi:hypothetical protein
MTLIETNERIDIKTAFKLSIKIMHVKSYNESHFRLAISVVSINY